jgi:hypothetical protein
MNIGTCTTGYLFQSAACIKKLDVRKNPLGEVTPNRAEHVWQRTRPVVHLLHPVIILFNRCKSAPHGVLGNHPRVHEMQQIIGSPGLGADAGHA